MRTLLNIIWLVFCGIWMAIGYAVAGVICCILIITIPFGIASFRLALYALWPFGRVAVDRPGTGSTGGWRLVGNILWLLFGGLPLAIGHFISGCLLCVTIIGIPFGIVSFRLAGLALMPLGREIVTIDEARRRSLHVVVATPDR